MDASGEDQGREPGEEISRPAPALEKIRKRKRVASSKLTHYSKRSLTAEIALAVIQPSVAARTTVRQQIRLAITRRYPSPGAPAICALGRPPARRRLRSAARPINRKLPVIVEPAVASHGYLFVSFAVSPARHRRGFRSQTQARLRILLRRSARGPRTSDALHQAQASSASHNIRCESSSSNNTALRPSSSVMFGMSISLSVKQKSRPEKPNDQAAA
jgi:hypothetical protein